MASKSDSSGKGCLFWGCLTLVVLAMLGGVGSVVMLFQVKKLADSVTDTQPVEIRVAQPSAEQAEKLKNKAEEFAEAIKQNRAETFTFTPEELNGLVAVLPEARYLRGKAVFRMEDETLKAEASIPLDQIPGLSGRYLNGKLALDIQCENGILEVFARDVIVKGEPLPRQFRERLSRQNLATEIYNHAEAREALKNIETIRIEDGKVVVRTRTRF